MKNKYLFVALLLFVLSGISFSAIRVSGLQEDDSEELVVVTSFYPVYVAALNVTDGIEGVRVENLTQPATGCLHDYQLTTKDLKTLEHADLLLINGGGMESFLDDVMQQYPNLEIVDTSENLSLLPVSESSILGVTDADHNHETEEDHDHETEEAHAHEHDHGDENAHVWMNIEDYCGQLDVMTTELSRIDEEHAQQYQDNTQAYEAKLKPLLEEARQIGEESSGGVILFHEAFVYLAQMCGLDVIDVIDMDENSSLSATQVKQVIDSITEQKVSHLLADETYGKKIAMTVEQQTTAKVQFIDPLVSGREEKNAYLDGMKENLKVLKEALN